MNRDMIIERARTRGKAYGSSVLDGNSTIEQALWLIHGYNEGDPVVMDLMPAPLSGEYAGESISELFDLDIGEAWPDEETLTEYEIAFSEAYWHEVMCHAQTIVASLVEEGA